MRVTVESFAYTLTIGAPLKRLLRLSQVAFFTFLFVTFSSISILRSAVIVRPEQAVYYVTPGETFDIRIHIDADDSTLGSVYEPLPNGLFSYGVQATFPGASATVPSVSQVTPTAQLNYFGFSTGALKQVTTGTASAKGNINPLGQPHSDSLLLTIQLTNLAPASSSYVVQLDEWRTLGPTEQIFVTGAGAVLDTSPTSNLFLPALIVVVPEPSALCLLMFSTLIAGRMRLRNRASVFFNPKSDT